MKLFLLHQSLRNFCIYFHKYHWRRYSNRPDRLRGDPSDCCRVSLRIGSRKSCGVERTLTGITKQTGSDGNWSLSVSSEAGNEGEGPPSHWNMQRVAPGGPRETALNRLAADQLVKGQRGECHKSARRHQEQDWWADDLPPASGRARGTGKHRGASLCHLTELSLPTLLGKVWSLRSIFQLQEANPHRCAGQRRWQGIFPPLAAFLLGACAAAAAPRAFLCRELARDRVNRPTPCVTSFPSL